VFGQMTGKIDDGNPEQALGWITAQYEALVGACDTAVAVPTVEGGVAITPATTE